MPSWNQILDEIRTTGSTHDVIRRRFLKQVYDKSGRNVILYYSGWLQKKDIPGADVNDSDKNGFMTVIHQLDRTKGLDLILHTPGGSVSATESLVDYLRQMFGTNIRAIVPQLAMSAGTMIACAAKTIMMGKQSSLGPIDPQLGTSIPAHGVVEEFNRAYNEIKADQAKIALWQPIIAKYHPTLIGECEKAIQWANEMVKEWLTTGMLENDQDKDTLADKIIKELADHALMKSHSRHLAAQRCKDMGLHIEMLEDDHEFQDAVLSLHHACIHTLTSTPATKIIENHEGVAYIQSAQTVLIQQK
ncbi:MAG: ATP-dependent Clp protease proteolytic subunit [Deltaproteobacteria bacterium]|nr:ATP-dependent Clp protease proteolytic subunit [Deltaproteobacteria bacterium]